jgi:3-phenylpropionate/trans-cinnamate dioxygenase ferredoxin subunit
MSETWHDTIAENDFPEEGKLALEIAGWSVLIVRTDQGFSALNDRCTHQAARLSPGRVRRGAIMCPLHGARFEAATGHCLGGAYPNLRRFELRVEGGTIAVLVPDTPPGPHERPSPL